MNIRGMFQVHKISELHWSKDQVEVHLQAVHAGTKIADSDSYAVATPSGSQVMTVKKSLTAPGMPFAIGTYVYTDYSIVPQ